MKKAPAPVKRDDEDPPAAPGSLAAMLQEQQRKMKEKAEVAKAPVVEESSGANFGDLVQEEVKQQNVSASYRDKNASILDPIVEDVDSEALLKPESNLAASNRSSRNAKPLPAFQT